jgi:hypothetical protein
MVRRYQRALPFEPALPVLRMNRAVARFRQSGGAAVPSRRAGAIHKQRPYVASRESGRIFSRGENAGAGRAAGHEFEQTDSGGVGAVH